MCAWSGLLPTEISGNIYILLLTFFNDIEVETRRDTPELFNMATKRGNSMSVNPTKNTPAPVAGGRRGRSKELPIMDHAAVGEDVVETPTRSPSSFPRVSPTRSRSGSGESRVGLMLASQASTASKRRKDKKDNKLADDEEELMVAFVEENEMLWDKKATHCRRPDLKNAAWQKLADTMDKEVAHLQGWFKGMRDNFARLDKLHKSGSGQRVFTERELWTLQKMHFLQKINSPMRVEGEVMRGWGGMHLATFCVHAHARNTPEERWARCTCVKSTLGVH